MIKIALAGGASQFEEHYARWIRSQAKAQLADSLEAAQATLGAELINAMRRAFILEINDSAAIDGAYTVKSETVEPASADNP